MENKFDFENKNPWPKIRKERIKKLLPQAMKCSEVDLWMILCRKNSNDPLAKHVGGENAEDEMAIIFQRKDDAVYSIVFCSNRDFSKIEEMNLHDELIKLRDTESFYENIANKIHSLNPTKIAINSSNLNIADGLSYTQRRNIEQALGFMRENLVSSQDLVSQWMSVKLDQEIEIIKRASFLCNEIILEAFNKIKPGKTNYFDLENYIKKEVNSYGVKNVALSISDLSNSEMVNELKIKENIIELDKFIRINLALKVYDQWCTHYQRYAYVLPKDNAKIPKEKLKKWGKANEASELILAKLKDGAMAYDIDLAHREWMHENKSDKLLNPTGNAIGYFLHDAGPYLTGGQREVPPTDALRILRKNQVFTYNGFYAWQDSESKKLISIRKMAVITDTGAKNLIDSSTELVSIANS